jgi:hypothetical protein
LAQSIVRKLNPVPLTVIRVNPPSLASEAGSASEVETEVTVGVGT